VTNDQLAARAAENESWLRAKMTPFFFDGMADEPEALELLCRELNTLAFNEHLILADREKSMILATHNVKGSLLRTLALRPAIRPISYAMFAHSTESIPGTEKSLEIQRYEFDCKTEAIIQKGFAAGVEVPAKLRDAVEKALRNDYKDYDRDELDHHLAVLWLNNESYVRVSPPRRVASTIRLLQRCERAGGLMLDVEEHRGPADETRISFAVKSPPHRGFLAQVLEVLNRLDLGVNRAYVLDVHDGQVPYGLLTFYVRPRAGRAALPGSALHAQLERELFNTQILSADSPEYKDLVVQGHVSGEDASLVRAFVAFCHTSLAHAQPDRFDWEEVRNAFHANRQLTQQMVELFRTRFDPSLTGRDKVWQRKLAEAEKAVHSYNTGHKHLDDVRRDVFRCCLAFIKNTLKTNFFVQGKTAFAFRLSPAYLAELGTGFTSDLPSATPFRITFFFTRDGFGYHIGFSDIARGGWRTVICKTDDDFLTNAATLFRENFVLAHTQHFKNKDIYEGGSKLVMLMDASMLAAEERDQVTLRLHKQQRGVFNAFLDVFDTVDGVARHKSVTDYYREDEPIELGPDENMHDSMIEEIARLSKRRGYLLGIGVMSSKEVGINHKEYGVTSTGVVKFAEITMKELGTDLRRHAFSVKFTGGPNGDVAGNAMQIMLDRCPKMQIKMILDGTAALFDPAGADHAALRAIVLKEDLHAFNPKALNPGGFLLYRSGSKKDGLREQFKKVTKIAANKPLQEEWLSTDDFSRIFGELVFTVQADLFIPAGGRPETIDIDNWQRFLLPDGTPSSRAIIEGANSFITPAARSELQKKGVIVMRDASANKCGVISSSYEIIANLMLSEEEFLQHKKKYVGGVLQILEKRAGDEAQLILGRWRKTGRPCTEISDAVSGEINGHKARLFGFFQSKPELCLQEPFRRAILAHLPALLREDPKFRRRLERLPQKYRSAILAAEIGSSMIYRGRSEEEYEDAVKQHIERHF
jgi:glutamate dehydrogenase